MYAIDQPYFNYSRTTQLMDQYEDILKPFKLLWPVLDSDQYIFEYTNIVTLSQERYEKMDTFVRKTLKQKIDLNMKNLREFSRQAKDALKIVNPMRPPYPVFDDFHITSNLERDDSVTPQEMFYKFESILMKTSLPARLADRFWISETTAESWIFEY